MHWIVQTTHVAHTLNTLLPVIKPRWHSTGSMTGIIYMVADMVWFHPGWAAPFMFASSLLKVWWYVIFLWEPLVHRDFCLQWTKPVHQHLQYQNNWNQVGHDSAAFDRRYFVCVAKTERSHMFFCIFTCICIQIYDIKLLNISKIV